MEQAASLLVPRGDLVELSNRLADGIRAVDAKAKVKPDSSAWLEPLRLLIDRDGRTADEVRDVIDWVLADGFEHRVVLSPAKLRERFTELALKANVARAPEPEFPNQFGISFRGYRNPSDPIGLWPRNSVPVRSRVKMLPEPILSGRIEPRTEVEPYRCQPCARRKKRKDFRRHPVCLPTTRAFFLYSV